MDVRMPDGTIISGVPEGVTQTELLERYNKYASAATAETKPAAEPAGLESIAPQRPTFDPTKPLSAQDYLAAVAQRKEESPDRSASDVAVDAGITFLKGAIGLPESFVGLADIPTKGAIGKMLEDAGYKPREAKDILDTYLSEAQQVANRKVAETKGFLPTIGAALQNPSTIATGVGESLPQMLGGASIARGILAAAPKMSAAIAGGLGEGILGAGSAAEQARGESEDKRLTTKQALSALGSGAGTAAFGIAGGKLAQKFGLDDVDTMLASGASRGGSKSVLDFAKRATGSGISEGAFEEMPQSAQEKMWMNYATDKPLLDGVPEAMGMGLTTGFAMGVGGAGAGSVLKRTPEDKQREKYERPAPDQGLEALARAKGFLTPERAAPKAEAPAPEVNLDREAELRDLMDQTARAEGKAAPQPVPVEEPIPNKLSPTVAETQQPVAEAPAAPVAETVAAKPEAEQFDSTGWEKQPVKINAKTGEPSLSPGRDRFKKVDDDGTTHSVLTKDGVVVQSNTRSPIVTLTNSILTDENESVSGRIEVDNRTGNLVFIGEGDQGGVLKMSPRAKQRYQEGVPFNKIAEEEFSDAGGIRPDGTRTPHTTTSVMEKPASVETTKPAAKAPTPAIEMDPKERLRRANVSMFNAQRMLANGQITADQYDDLKRQYDDIKLRASDVAQRAKQPIVPSVEPKGEYKETKSLETFFAPHKDDKKRLDNLPKYGQPEVKQVVAELNQAIQKVTDAINAKGYSADAIKHKVPADVRPLFSQFSTLTGGGSRLLIESERVGNNKKLANPEKLAKAIAESQADVANAYKFLGIEPEAVAPKAPEAPKAPKAKAKPKTNLDKVAHLRKLAWEKNPLMAFVADKGLFYKKGERDNLMSEFNGGKQKMISGYGPVFKAAGLRLDALLPIAIQDGFVAQDATEQDLYALIQQAFSGKRIEALYTEQGQEDLAKQYTERMDVEEAAYEERAGQSDAEWYGMDEDAYINLMASEVAELTPEEMAELDASVAEFKDTPASNVSMRAAMEALGFTEEEIQNEERRTAAKAPEAVATEKTTGDQQGAPAAQAKAITEPPVPKGSVRLYHSGEVGEGETGRWVSTNREYAANYRPDLPLFYLDVKADDPRVNNPDYPDQGAKQGFTFNFELSGKEAAQLTEISRKAPEELELKTQTEDELKAKQAEVDRLTKENERLAKEAEAKAKADAEREEFVLTGSDRAADVAAAQGQQDIFGAEKEAPEDKFKKYTRKPVATTPKIERETNPSGKTTDGVEWKVTGPSGEINRFAKKKDAQELFDSYSTEEKPTSNEVVTFIHKTDSEPGQGSRSGHYPGTYAYEAGFEVPAIFAPNKKNTFTGSLKESEIYTMTDSEALKREASEAGFPYRQASGFPETQYLKSLGYKAMRRGPEIIVFDAKDANFKKAKPEVASEVVGPAEKPAAPQLTREPVTIEGEFTEVGEEKQRALITDQTKKLSDAQVSTLEKFYGFARDTEEFANAARQDVVNFITKGAAYVNGKIRAIIRSMANGVLSVAVAFNPQFVSMPYTIAVPQYETRIEQVMQEVPASVQKQMSEDAKRAYATIYPAIKAELQANDKFFIVADKQTANTFVFNPDGSPFMQSKTLFGAGIGDFLKGNNNIVSNRITPAGLFDLGLRDAKRSVDEAATAGEYDFGKVFVLDKSQKGANGLYSTTIMHSVWTKEADAKQRLAALQKPGAEDSRYSFGCINVDKETYGKLVTNNLAQMDGAKIFIVPENGKDVMSFVNGEATYSTDIIRQRAEPVTKETKQEVQRAAETAPAERTVAAKEEEGPVFNSIESATAGISPVQEEKQRSPSFKRKVAKLNRDHQKGKITTEQLANEVDWALKQSENDRLSKEPAKKERGYLEIVKRLAEATKKGDISKESFDLATWFMRNNEALVDDLGVSIRGTGDAGVGGQYVKLSRVMRLIKGGGSDLTVVHEILHHLERMMPTKVQQSIRKAWGKQLASAQKKAKTPAEQLYFKLLMDGHYGDNNFDFVDVPDGEMSKVFMKALAELDFDRPGSKSSFELAETLLKMGVVPITNYQYFNPSEFWAVNGSEMVKGRFDAVQGGTLSRLKNWLKELAQQIKGLLGMNSKASIIGALDSLAKADGAFVTEDMLGEGAYKSVHRNYRGNEAPDSAWTSMDEDKLDTAIYNLADKHIDTKRVIENIRKTSGDIAEDWDAYTKEELYHGRTAKAINDFLDNEMLPITKEMKANNVTLDELDEYLHNRHAEERNIQINRINPNPALKDRGSGIATKDAVKYLSELSPERAKIFESLAAQVDSIVTKTQDILVKSGMETQQTIDDWNNAYEHYVPLQRDDLEYVHTGSGISGGYATRGKTSKRATGSLKSVVDIFENIAIQRERAVMKAERARVGRALYGLAIKYPNPEFWLPVNPDAIKNKGELTKELVAMGLSPADAENLFQEPTVADIDKKTGEVKYVINQNNRYSENVFPIRINGQDRFIIFNGSDPRAERMVKAMKNLDAEQLGVVVGAIGEVTRFLASVNTQYNPVFGAWNFLRDVQGAALNLSTTEIAGQEKQVLAGISPTKGMPALRAIYRNLRGKGATTPEMQEWIDLFEQYQKAGGATGYKDQFSKGRDAPGIVERELKKLDRGNVRKAADAVFNWLSDYNDAMENAVRLSAFKVAVTPVSEGGLGLSEDKAASIAKNLTVNFNRKGAASPTFQALYAFFNASVQGTARLAETLKGPAGRKIMAGGFMIGVAQAIALAMAGFDDDDPPEFLKNKNLIIPTDWLGTEGGKYLIVPMPMGFSIFPGVGRLVTEYMLGQGGMITGAKGAGDKIASAASLILDSFNPLGSGSFLQMLAPTPADPLVAIATNRDAFGRPIAKEDRATSPTPGYTRSRENASYVSKKLAEFLNYVSSPMGTKYTKGGISPTADQLDYLAGQIGGGVSRELLKTGEYLSAVAKGETSETPSYRVPIVGKMYGETETPAAISSKFYQNVTLLAEMENEIKSRQKNREDTKEYRADHPESRLINRANYLENQITALNKQKKLLQEKDAPAERIKKIDEQKTKLMKGLNDQIKKIQQ